MSDMINLKRGPVHRIVATEGEARALMAQGYIKVDDKGQPIKVESKADNAELQKQVTELTTACEDLIKTNKTLTDANAELQKQVTDLTAQLKKASAK